MEVEVPASIIVPTRNRPAKLARLLSSLDALQSHPKEVIVVDDGSDTCTSIVLEAWQKESHRFETMALSLGGKGPGAARNRGVAAAKEEKVAFIDDDCIPHPEWLARIVQGMDVDQRVVGVGGKILPLRSDVISKYYGHYRILEPPLNLEYLVTANCCYLRRPLAEAGGFVEEIEKPGGEDVGLSFKLARSGWRFRFEEDALVYHDFRTTVSDFARTFWNYGSGVHRASLRFPRPSKTGVPGRRGGYGYGSLAPSSITPISLMREAAFTYRSLCPQEGVRTAVAFGGLRILQRLAYYRGWVAGAS